MSNELISSVIEAIVGSSLSFTFDEASKILKDKNKKKDISSVVPAPKFTILSRVESGNREIFLELKEVSGNRISSMCLIESEDEKFKKAFLGYSYLPKIEPRETSNEFLLGTVSRSESSDGSVIKISVLLANADLNEVGSIHEIFEGTLNELIEITENADHSSNDLDISISGYSISDAKASALSNKYLASERLKISSSGQYDMAQWDIDCSKVDKNEIASWLISKQFPRNYFRIKNQSKSRVYENLEIEITSEHPFILISSVDKNEIIPEPKIISKYNIHLSDLRNALSIRPYLPLLNQDESVYAEGERLFINIQKLRAFQDRNIDTEELSLVFFCSESSVNCEVEIRDDNHIKYFKKSIVIKLTSLDSLIK